MYTLNNIDFDNSNHRNWLVFAKRLHQDLLINNKDRYGVEQKADIICPGTKMKPNKSIGTFTKTWCKEKDN